MPPASRSTHHLKLQSDLNSAATLPENGGHLNVPGERLRGLAGHTDLSYTLIRI